MGVNRSVNTASVLVRIGGVTYRPANLASESTLEPAGNALCDALLCPALALVTICHYPDPLAEPVDVDMAEAAWYRRPVACLVAG